MSFNLKIEARFSTEPNSKSIMASVVEFKSAVVRIRDILRGPGVSITGMGSMRHICLYLMSRYMTKDKVQSLGVPDEFAWENLIETAQTKNGGLQKALDCFFHKEADDCLVYHFDRLFGTEKFSFDIKSLSKHKEMLEILDKVNMEGMDLHMDILGWVYEQHLKTGSSAARDLGQFFTDRSICDYMVKICNPGFKSKGVPESVCDPSMGTGGFLTSYMKFYKKQHADKPIDWSIQYKEIHGCDTDAKVAGVARMNLFMESGGKIRNENPKDKTLAKILRTHDSLYGDLTLTGYDLILANMPFGLKGIKHAECCERVKDLKIRGTKSEPLFLQLMMISLNRGGRCAVVVPDGMLVNSSSCHNDTRKYLLDNFELRRVIKMKGQFFMNTGIQPSILFFENTGNPTSVVEFWDVIKAANGEIEETMVLSVPRENFDASCSFDMRRYQEVKAVANPAGFPIINISEKCSMAIGGTPLRCKSEYYEDGQHVWISVSELNNKIIMDSKEHINDEGVKNSNVKLVKKGSVLMSFKMSIGKCAIAGVDLYTNEAIVAFYSKDDSILSNKYLFYHLSLLDLSNNGKGSIGSGSMNKTSLSELTMLLPPIEIQQEIVATLDRIYAPGTSELSETLKLTDKAMDLVLANPGGASLEPIVEAQRLMRKSAQMVADVKAQMVALVKSVDHRGFPTGKVGDNVSFMNGYAFKSEEFIDSGVPIVKIKNIKSSILSFEKVQYSKQDTKLSKYAVKHGDMVISLTGELSGDVGINLTGLEWYLNQRVARIDIINKEFHPQYMYYYLVYSGFTEAVRNLSTGSAQPNVSTKNIESLTLPLPPIEFQESIIMRLNAFQTQLSSLENLGKQAEDNARFILDSYLNTA
jgi:type I restriction enzyme S subunit